MFDQFASPARRRGRPKGSGITTDGPILQEIAALLDPENNGKLQVAAIRQVANHASRRTTRRLQEKWSRLIQELQLGPNEREPFDPVRHKNAALGTRTWISSQALERWEKAGRFGWNMERGAFVNGEHVCKIRRDLEDQLPAEDDLGEATRYLQRFEESGFTWSVRDGVVCVCPPEVVLHRAASPPHTEGSI
jgi:hypothetical protein